MTFVKTALFHKAGEGSGGGDQHNLGWYATEAALESAHATATDGDWAIVGATDTVWVWDSDSTAWKDTGQAGIELPDQTGHSGEFLITNGTSVSWSDKPLVNVDTHTNSLVVGGSNTSGDGNTLFGSGSSSYGGGYNTVLGAKSQGRNSSTIIGCGIQDSSSQNAVVIRSGATSFASYANGISNAFTWVKGTTKYELFSSDGTIPADRLPKAINKYSTMPTAAADNEGWIVQFTGTTDATYTHGYIYECVSDGGNPATYSWTAVQVQAGGGGGLQNTATGTYSLTIIGNASTAWGSVNIGDNATATGGEALVAIGKNASATGTNNGGGGIAIGYNSVSVSYKLNFYQAGIAIGAYAEARTPYPSDNTDKAGTLAIGTGAIANQGGSIAIGDYAKASGIHAIQLGCMGNSSTCVNSDANTFKVANHNGNYEMMSANGTIPTARLTKVNSTITLTAAGWSSNTQTVTVSGVTSSSIVWVSPDPTDQSAYVSAGILCTAQGTDSLTFTATTTPSADIDVVVVAM